MADFTKRAPCDTYNSVPSPADSESISNPSKKIKYESNSENGHFYEGYANIQHQYNFNQQRAQALMLHGGRFCINSASSSRKPSMDGYPLTPSPDYAMDLHPPSSALFPMEPPPLRYFQPGTQFFAPIRTSAEHNYAVGFPKDSPAAVSVIQPPQSSRARVEPTSNNSTISDLKELCPMNHTDWVRNAVRPELAALFQKALDTINYESEIRKVQYDLSRKHELPTDIGYNPKKSRFEKKYESVEEQQARKENNKASRKSRLKKKVAQAQMNIDLDFINAENRELYAMQNWLGQLVLLMEDRYIRNAGELHSLVNLRKQCGFSRRLQDKQYISGNLY